MSYNAIRRGPMGGDAYSKVHNGVFRDKRLTPNAVCVFAYLSTHAQDWQTSVAGIARDRGLGESLVKAALACLKKYHYVVYGQDRNPDGTRGPGWYFITDLPAQLEAMGVDDEETVALAVSNALADWTKRNPRSEPVSSEAPPVSPAETQTAKPRVSRSRKVTHLNPRVPAGHDR